MAKGNFFDYTRVRSPDMDEVMKNIDSAFAAEYGAGTTYYVDPANGNESRDGKSLAHAVKKISTAYGLCTSGAGDTIKLYSTSTATENSEIEWTKDGITVVGYAAPINFGGRAKIANKSGAHNLPYLINLQGHNNSFYNIHFGTDSGTATALDVVKITGQRNYFGRCQIANNSATPMATVGGCDLEINGAAASPTDELTFEGCVFGNDSTARTANVPNIKWANGAYSQRVRFDGCEFMANGTVATQNAIYVSGVNSINRDVVLRDCTFIKYLDGAIDVDGFVIGGENPTNGFVLVCGTSCHLGYAAWAETRAGVYLALGATCATLGGMAVVSGA